MSTREQNQGGLSAGWAELRSQARWLWTYRLPKALAGPFQSAPFKVFYSTILVTLVLVGLLSLPFLWTDLFKAVLADVLGKLGAERSLESALQWLASLKAGWLLALLWLVYGLLAWFWAEPRRKFLHEVETNLPVILVRGGGERIAFLTRLNRALNSGLGLGPTGELLAYYLARPEDEQIRVEADAILRKRETHQKGVLISAEPTMGKTRCALELLAELDPPLVLVWRAGGTPGTVPSLPEWAGRSAILADDLTFGSAAGEGELPQALSYLAGRCRQGLIVATARSEHTPQDVRALKVFTLKEAPEQDLKPLAEAVARHETRRLGKKVTEEDVMGRYDGRPGSLVAGFDAMRGLYEGLPPEPRAFLQTLRQMHQMGLRRLTLERAWACYADLWKEDPAPLKQSEILSDLASKAFLRLGAEGQIGVYEAYFDRVIPQATGLPDAEQRLWKGLITRKDGHAFFEIGNTWNEEFSPAFQHDPQACLDKAIAAYKQALEYYTHEVAPLDYAMTQNNLGLAYAKLAEHLEPVENLGKAVAAYERALEYYTPKADPLGYAGSQVNLGNAYQRLAEHGAPVGNLGKAIAVYERTLEYLTPTVAPLDYAGTQNNLGIAYRKLAEHREPVENLGKAVAAYERALEFYTPETAPLDYAMTQNNLGHAYADLANHREPVENLGKAIAAFDQALEHYTPEAAPLGYAATQNNLGNTYAGLADHRDAVENLGEAIAAYERALEYRTPEVAPQDYAMTQVGLGVAYLKLADHRAPVENLGWAIAAYERALEYYTPAITPLKYAATQANLGNAYQKLAEHREPVENLGEAVAAYERALEHYTPEATPLNYATTQNNLGLAYAQLADLLAPVENLGKAVAAYERALKYYTPDVAPLNYAMAQLNLGSAYVRLAEHREQVENLGKAVAAYERALKYYTPDVAPLNYATAQLNLGAAYASLSDHRAPVENLGKAVAAYGRALEYLTPEAAPLVYARIQANLGNAYADLAVHRAPVENLGKAVAAYKQTLKYLTPAIASLDYAMTQNNLGTAYCQLAEHRDPVENLGMAIAAYERALEYRTPEVAPLDYAETQNNLGTAYHQLVDHRDPVENLGKAIAAFEQALEYRTREVAPLYHYQTQESLARTYLKRARYFILRGALKVAEQDLSRVEALDPDSPYTHYLAGQLHFVRGEYPQSAERLRQADARHEDPTGFNFYLALPLLCLGEVGEALQAIRSRLEAYPCPPELDATLWDYEQLGRQQPGLAGILEALELLWAAQDRCRGNAG